jgi:hypothetical protein
MASAEMNQGASKTGDDEASFTGETYTCRARCRNGIAQAIEIQEFRVGIEDYGWTHGPTGRLEPGQAAGPTGLLTYQNDANTSVYVRFRNTGTGHVFEAQAGEFDLEEENSGETLDVAIEEVLKVFYKDNDVEKADWRRVS